MSCAHDTQPKRVAKAFTSGLVLLVAFVSLQPSVASACSVCTAGRDEENQAAFLLSTLFMSLLPLIVIGTIVFVLWRRVQRLEREGDPVAAHEVSLQGRLDPATSRVVVASNPNLR